MSYFPNLAVGGVIPSVRKRYNPGGYASNRRGYVGRRFGRLGRRTGYRVGYRDIGSAGAGMYSSMAGFHRVPSYRQHPLKGAIAASVLNDHRDVAYHVKQSFRKGLLAGRGRRFGRPFRRSFGRGPFRRSFRSRRFGARRYGGGY